MARRICIWNRGAVFILLLTSCLLYVAYLFIPNDNKDENYMKSNNEIDDNVHHAVAGVFLDASQGRTKKKATVTNRRTVNMVNETQDLSSPISKPQPNIVFILADDLGWNDVGYHGSEIKTPVLDRLAEEGVKLENYYVQAVCSPSRASLMTGLYQSHTGVDRIFQPSETACLPLHLPLIPESLQDLGYSTHLIGKWHLGMSRRDCLPLQRGFDSFFGMYGGSAGYYTHSKIKKAINENFTVSGYDFRDNDRVARNYVGQYATQLYASRAEKLIARHAKNKKPMFLFVAMQAPHSPLEVPDTYLTQYSDIEDKKRRVFAAMTTCMDEAIGNITHALDRHDMRSNTVVIFSSDNGGAVKFGASNIPLRGNKGMYYEGGIRVVGLVNSPMLSTSVKGQRYTGLMGAADWYRTLVEGLAGGKMIGRTDGYNMWPRIRNGSPSPRTEYLHSVGGDCIWQPKSPLQLHDPDNVPLLYGTIRVGPWKLKIGHNGQKSMISKDEYLKMNDSITLFNLEEDPYEETNRLESHQEVFQQLLKRLKFHCRTHVQYLPCEEDKRSDPRTRDGVYGPYL